MIENIDRSASCIQ